MERAAVLSYAVDIRNEWISAMRLPVIAALIAAAIILLWPVDMRTPADSRAYLRAANAFAQGHDDPAFSQWPPGYPLLLATGVSPRLLNALTYAALVYLVLSNVERYRLALAAAMLSPLMLYNYLFVLSDGLFVLLCVAVLLELPRTRVLPLALLLTAAVMVKYAGLFLLIFAAAWLIGQGRYQKSAYAVFLPLTAFLGWSIRCYALYGKLTTTAPIARYTVSENIGGALTTVLQFGGVLCALVCLEILFSRLRSRTRRSSLPPASPAP